MYLILVAAEESLPAGHPCHLVPMEPLGRHSDAVSMRRLLVLSLYACMLQTTKNPCKRDDIGTKDVQNKRCAGST